MAKWTRFERRHRGDFYPSNALLCSVPALKAAVTKIYHQTNQGKITKESSLKGC